MMKKGKGYLEHVLSKSKTYGNAFETYDKDVIGPRSLRGVLNEWSDDAWRIPEPEKNSRNSTMFD
jgi:hypothetical protein